MINQVKKAIQEIERLPRDKQIEIAQLIQDELRWDTTFKENQDNLSALAQEALREYKAGNTSDKDW